MDVKDIQSIEQSLIDTQTAHICILDNTGKIILVNDKWKSFAEQNEFVDLLSGIGTNYLKLCESVEGPAAEEIQQICEAINKIMSGESESYSITYPCHSPDEERWFKVIISPYRGKNKNGSVVLTHLNITEHMSLINSLKESEIRQKNFMENTTDAIWCFEFNPPVPVSLPLDEQIEFAYKSARIVEANDAWAEFSGYKSGEEMIGLTGEDVVPRSKPNNIEVLKEAVKSKWNLKNFITIEEYEEGKEIIVENSMYGMIENEKLYRLWGTARDITSQKIYELKLKQDRAYLRAFIDGSQDAICARDLDLKLIFWNEKFADNVRNISGIELEVGMSANDYLPGKKLDPAFGEEISRVINERTVKQSEFPYDISGIGMTYHQITWAPIIVNDEVIGISEITRDITKQTKAVAELKENEANLKAFLDGMENTFRIIDNNGALVLWNKSFEEIILKHFGNKIEVGMKSEDYMPLSVIEKYVDVGMLFKKSYYEGPQETEFSYELPNGDLSYNHIKWIPIKAEDNVIGVAEFNTDITEQKNAQISLLKSEEKYRSVIENANEMIMISQDYKIKFFNQKTCEITGYTSEELIDFHFLKLIHEDDREKVLEEYEKRISKDVLKANYDVRILTKSNINKWVTVNSAYISWEDEPATLTLVTDITPRKQAQQELEKAYHDIENTVIERTQELSRAMENLKKTQDELVLTEKLAAIGQLVAGVAHEMNTPLGVIKQANININNALNESLTNLPNLFSILSPETQNEFTDILNESLLNKNFLTTIARREVRENFNANLSEVQIPNSDLIAETLVDINFTGDLSRYYNLFRDKNIDKILSSLYNLVRLKNNNDNIKLSAEKASTIVSSLKLYSIEDKEAKISDIKIADNINTIIRLYESQLEGKIELNLDLNYNPTIQGYKDDLDHIWINLINNSIYAIGSQGLITIKTEQCKNRDLIKHLDQSKEYVLVIIKDNGIGIPDENRDRIFSPFFTTKSSGEGSGIGLDICKRIVLKHNGAITFTSRSGETTFFICLPIL